MKNVPFVAFGNDELKDSPSLHIGDFVKCHICNGNHVVKGGIDENGNETSLLLFFKCDNGKSYLAGIDNKRVNFPSKS